jgi:hypothetical protein
MMVRTDVRRYQKTAVLSTVPYSPEYENKAVLTLFHEFSFDLWVDPREELVLDGSGLGGDVFRTDFF